MRSDDIWNRQLQYTVTFVLAKHRIAVISNFQLDSMSVYKELYMLYKNNMSLLYFSCDSRTAET